jgi:hypothetical protein
MIQKEFYINLDIKQLIPKNIGSVVRNDVSGNMVLINLVDGSDPFDITGYTTITFTVLKPDKTYYIDSLGTRISVIDAAKGYISVVLGDQAIDTNGLCLATIEVFQGASRITSAKLSFLVVKELSEGADPSGESAYPLLLELMLQLSQAEALKVIAENGRVLAEASRVTAEGSRVIRFNQMLSDMLTYEVERNTIFEQLQGRIEGLAETYIDRYVLNRKDFGDFRDVAVDAGGSIDCGTFTDPFDGTLYNCGDFVVYSDIPLIVDGGVF